MYRSATLQHFQMETEKLAKAVRLFLDPNSAGAEYSHVAFREVIHVLKRPDVARRLGYAEEPQQFKHFVERRKSWFIDVEQLCPSVGSEATGGSPNGPNVEYPWRTRDEHGKETWIVPMDYEFPFVHSLRSRDEIQFIKLVRTLLDRMPEAVNGPA